MRARTSLEAKAAAAAAAARPPSAGSVSSISAAPGHSEQAGSEAFAALVRTTQSTTATMPNPTPLATSTAPAWYDLREDALAANKKGMLCLRMGDGDNALVLLNQAQELLHAAEELTVPGGEHRLSLKSAWAVTASNLGVYYKRAQNFPLAVKHLCRALELHQATGPDARTHMAAHLNLAACHLEAETPDLALQHGLAAIECGLQLAQSTSGGKTRTPPHPPMAVEGQRPDDSAILAIAYHKVAEAHEALKDWTKASYRYAQAYDVVMNAFGPDHHLTKTFEKSTRCPTNMHPPEEEEANSLLTRPPELPLEAAVNLSISHRRRPNVRGIQP
eukprot:gnl/TRDRNA2_/TRDRNA2_84971_c0_seq1.p1 gnl/TRDRNA2_/TRDRNA2_84971_c0~~gnl/TRDRNA2_/TRDRNA2_84971_c0_seq1.p1  ORF type:complete len:332 (+),score=54.57 gnl/TRDRNA2_/TRDRNA2_84971_c0_seq1:76-1071(+)